MINIVKLLRFNLLSITIKQFASLILLNANADEHSIRSYAMRCIPTGLSTSQSLNAYMRAKGVN